jgi:hypothetical protein
MARTLNQFHDVSLERSSIQVLGQLDTQKRSTCKQGLPSMMRMLSNNPSP